MLFKSSKKEYEKEFEEIVEKLDDNMLIERWQQKNEYSEKIVKLLEKEIFKRGIPIYENTSLYDYEKIDNKVFIDRKIYNYKKNSFFTLFIKEFLFVILFLNSIIIVKKLIDIYNRESCYIDNYVTIVDKLSFVLIFEIILLIGIVLINMYSLKIEIYNMTLYKLKKEKF
ncbi:MAG: hypothetical protein GX287_05890 [Fusobacteria bacterium]|nr:hypothetical protein [Fusobacteriota bacterium]